MVKPRIVMPRPVIVTAFAVASPWISAVPCPSNVIRATSWPRVRFSLQTPDTTSVSPGFKVLIARPMVRSGLQVSV